MANPVRTLRELHYLYIPKPSGRTVAHCLDLDIVTAANDIDEAEKRLDLLVTIHIEAALAVGNYAALNMDAHRSTGRHSMMLSGMEEPGVQRSHCNSGSQRWFPWISA